MPADLTAPARFADLWSMLYEGGLLIETRITEDAESPVALRTLLQLDGDRIVWIGRNSLASMSHYQRLRVVVRHRRKVRQHSMQLLSDASRWLPWLRYTGFALFAAHATGRGVADWPFDLRDWQAVLWHQAPSVALLAASLFGPQALAFLVPRILRWRAGDLVSQRIAERRQASKRYYDSVRVAASHSAVMQPAVIARSEATKQSPA